MSDYLDLHIDIARHFEDPRTQDLLKTQQLLYNHSFNESIMLVQRFPREHMPFATEENWNAFGRTLKNSPEAFHSFVFPDGKLVYSILATEGDAVPTLPMQQKPPRCDEETFQRIWNWLEDLRKGDDIDLSIQKAQNNLGGYSLNNNKIIIPEGAEKEFQLRVYMFGYLVSLQKEDPKNMDEEDLDDYNVMLHTVIYKLFKDRGYDTERYGKDYIAIHAENYRNYEYMIPDINEMLSFFEQPSLDF